MKNLKHLKKLNEVFDILGATQVERTAILYGIKMGHKTFPNESDITLESIQKELDRVAVKN